MRPKMLCLRQASMTELLRRMEAKPFALQISRSCLQKNALTGFSTA
jgi:hypothetical protein